MEAFFTVGAVNMTWNNDDELMRSLDLLLVNSKTDLDNFLNLIFKYKDELGIVGNALLFGGLGKIVTHYNLTKESGKSIEESLALAFAASHNDRRVQRMMGHAVEQAIDEKVSTMKGE